MPRRLIAADEPPPPSLSDQLEDTPLFGGVKHLAGQREAWRNELAPAVVEMWDAWAPTEEGRATVGAVRDLALRKLKENKSRLFIDELVWEARARDAGCARGINNSLRSALARHLMATTPDLAGCFEVRKIKKAG